MVDNRTLTVLVLVSMTVSLAGTLATISLVRVPEEMVTGFAAHQGLTNVSIGRFGDVYLNISLVNFGTIQSGQSNDTTDFSPHPFVIENNGSVFVNVTVVATALWDDQEPGLGTANYRVNATENESGTLSATDGYAADFTNMDDSPAIDLIQCMNYSDSADAMTIHIEITVPSGEQSGYKESTVTFTGSDSETGNCGE